MVLVQISICLVLKTSRYVQNVFHYVQNVLCPLQYKLGMCKNLFVMSFNKLLCIHCGQSCPNIN